MLAAVAEVSSRSPHTPDSVFELEVSVAILHLLGTGAAFSDAARTTTMLALTSGRSAVVIDCGGDVVQRLLEHSVDLDTIDALIVTHEHADHVSGFPLMLERLWLAGRKRPLDVYGIHSAVEQARRIHDAFDTSQWPGYPEIRYHVVEHKPEAPVLEIEAWKIVATPGRHSVPVIALRIHAVAGGGVLVYSCDTERSSDVESLARGADLLVHEATGGGPGHSTAADAAAVANAAGVPRLVLIHIAPHANADDKLQQEIDDLFPGAIIGQDGARFEF